MIDLRSTPLCSNARGSVTRSSRCSLAKVRVAFNGENQSEIPCTQESDIITASRIDCDGHEVLAKDEKGSIRMHTLTHMRSQLMREVAAMAGKSSGDRSRADRCVATDARGRSDGGPSTPSISADRGTRRN